MLPISTPTLGVCYYPEHWPPQKWSTDFDQMRELGIRLVRVAEFAWSRLEPSPGEYRFEWLKEVLDLAAERQLWIVLCTPTPTPPKWLVDQMPDMLPVAANGSTKKFGSRRHYCFSHNGYRTECERIVTQIARAFGTHPAVAAWQTDNEYGCHDTVLSYSDAALNAFRDWLKYKYGSIDRLNQAWGNVFWSMEYRSFDEIELPNRTVTDPNPTHELEFRRFSSDQVKKFNRLQVDIIRTYSPGRTVIHNFMGGFQDFDHFDLSEDLDAAGWDSYPLGFLTQMKVSEEHKLRYLRTGDPDFIAFHHDLYRTCGRGRWWILEQQPGPVNWAPYNPSPYPGMVRSWTHEAFAHGAEVVSYFRWRQAPFAQEQMHSGLQLPNGEPDNGIAEVRQTAKELSQLQFDPAEPAKVALLYDYEAAWTLQIQPQGDDFDYMEGVLRFYRSVRRLGLNVDVISCRASLEPYRLLLIPSLPILPAELLKSLKQFDGHLLIAPRTGSKTADFQIPPDLPPGGLQKLIPLTVTRVESLPVKAPLSVTWNSIHYECHGWLEHVRSGIEPFIRTESGLGIAYRHGKLNYLAALPDQSLLNAIVEELAHAEKLPTEILDADLRARDRGALRYYFNYGPEPITLQLSPTTKYLVGGPEVPTAGVTIVEKAKVPSISGRGY
jgi:beta-galactosidase